jgi:EAL domain-containing protein (putative c-di-GMP-specific phosphodiesterase class I)
LPPPSIDPDDLILEITETAVISNMDEARRFAETLSRLGCRFALDDFGTGFGSYYYLKHLPLHYIKIDGDFIRNLAHSPTDQLMVRAMVQVAQGLGMKTVAEFVEECRDGGVPARLRRRLRPGLSRRAPAADRGAVAGRVGA